jgi:hypothetical protein
VEEVAASVRVQGGGSLVAGRADAAAEELAGGGRLAAVVLGRVKGLAVPLQVPLAGEHLPAQQTLVDFHPTFPGRCGAFLTVALEIKHGQKSSVATRALVRAALSLRSLHI